MDPENAVAEEFLRRVWDFCAKRAKLEIIVQSRSGEMGFVVQDGDVCMLWMLRMREKHGLCSAKIATRRPPKTTPPPAARG